MKALDVYVRWIMIVIQRLWSYLEKITVLEHTAQRFAITVCLGVYIGISPFVGFHTIMTFACAWFFSLNLGTLFAVSVLIHNPWTTIPVYTLDHVFGKWLLGVCNVSYANLDPAWMEPFNSFIFHHTGISGLSLSAFLIGGNILAIGASVLMYPFAKWFYGLSLARKMNTSSAIVVSE